MLFGSDFGFQPDSFSNQFPKTVPGRIAHARFDPTSNFEDIGHQVPHPVLETRSHATEPVSINHPSGSHLALRFGSPRKYKHLIESLSDFVGIHCLQAVRQHLAGRKTGLNPTVG